MHQKVRYSDQRSGTVPARCAPLVCTPFNSCRAVCLPPHQSTQSYGNHSDNKAAAKFYYHLKLVKWLISNTDNERKVHGNSMKWMGTMRSSLFVTVSVQHLLFHLVMHNRWFSGWPRKLYIYSGMHTYDAAPWYGRVGLIASGNVNSNSGLFNQSSPKTMAIFFLAGTNECFQWPIC